MPEATPQGAPVTQPEAASLLNVSERSVRAAVNVRDHGTPALIEKVQRGEVSVSAADAVARLPEAEQRQIVAKGGREILQAASRIRAERSQAGKRERRPMLQSATSRYMSHPVARARVLHTATPPYRGVAV